MCVGCGQTTNANTSPVVDYDIIQAEIVNDDTIPTFLVYEKGEFKGYLGGAPDMDGTGFIKCTTWELDRSEFEGSEEISGDELMKKSMDALDNSDYFD